MPKVELKQPVIEEIASVVQDADSVVLVNYSGLTVEQDTQLRRNMREAGVTYKVYKNTMMNFAFKDTPYEELCKDLKGTNALAVSKDDATAPARLITEFAKKAPVIELVSAVVEGKYYNTDEVKALAQVPSREVLLSKLLGSLQSPIANLARVLNQIAEQGGAPAAAEAPAEEAPAEAAAEAPAEEAPAEEAAEAPAEEAPAEETTEEPAAE